MLILYYSREVPRIGCCGICTIHNCRWQNSLSKSIKIILFWYKFTQQTKLDSMGIARDKLEAVGSVFGLRPKTLPTSFSPRDIPKLNKKAPASFLETGAFYVFTFCYDHRRRGHHHDRH